VDDAQNTMLSAQLCVEILSIWGQGSAPLVCIVGEKEEPRLSCTKHISTFLIKVGSYVHLLVQMHV